MPPEEMKAITGTFNGNTFSCTIDGIPVEMKTKPFKMPELSDETDDKPAFKEFMADIGELRPGGTYRQLIDKMIGICEHDWARICRLRNEKKFSRARWTGYQKKTQGCGTAKRQELRGTRTYPVDIP